MVVPLDQIEFTVYCILYMGIEKGYTYGDYNMKDITQYRKPQTEEMVRTLRTFCSKNGRNVSIK